MERSTKVWPGKTSEEGSSISPVYSLAVHHQGLWLLSGVESGGINLQSVRVDEGKQIACLRGHTSAVSVLQLSHDEQSVLSGSWDKTVLEWDLNTGQTKRNFGGSGSQISALETRPLSSLPVPETVDEVKEANGTFSSKDAAEPRINGASNDILDNHAGQDSSGVGDAFPGGAASPTDSLFGGGDVDSLFGDNENADANLAGANFGDDDEFSKVLANGISGQEHEIEKPQPGKLLDAEGDIDMGIFDDTIDMAKPDEGIDGQPVLNGHVPEALSDKIQEPGSPNKEDGHSPHAEDILPDADASQSQPFEPLDSSPKADSTFLAASIDGSIRIWDKRQPKAVATMTPKNAPPWCMNATWSPDGNFIYAGRRNGTVDEYNLHKNLQNAERSFKLPNNSGAVSAVRALPNGRHLLW